MTGLAAITIDAVPRGYELMFDGDPVSQFSALGSALVSSPSWPERARAIVVSEPEPKLVLGGWFDEVARIQLGHLNSEIAHTTLRYVDYREVGALTERMAERLVDTLGSVDDWGFWGVPRGGLIVAGLLSYHLDLDADQLGSPDEFDRIVIVDDCSLSGRRIGDQAQLQAARPTVVATLLSVPALRCELAAQHGLEAFVTGGDLPDRAPERYGDGYEAWLERWQGRDDTLWIGRTDHLAFPWNEPDVTVWNESAGRGELAWRLVPPSLCAKNRAGPRVRVHEPGDGPIRQPSGVVDLQVDDSTVLIDLPTSRVAALNGPASAMWTAVIETGEVSVAAEELAARFDVEVETVEEDLHDLVRELASRSLLTGLDDDQAS